MMMSEESVTEEEYENLNEVELAALMANPDMEIIGVEEEGQQSYAEDEETGEMMPVASTFNLKVKVREKTGKIRIENVPPEEFLVNRRATSLEDAFTLWHTAL